MIKVAVDAMGGDHAPVEVIRGAVSAVQKNENVSVALVGRPDVIEPVLKELKFDVDRISIVPASEVIDATDHPVEAIRKKKDSSMNVGMKMVHDGEAQAFVSAGNSGALMVGAQVVVGREKDVKRAPFAHLVPTEKGMSLLLDCGANVDVRPEHLLSFAKLGSDYVKTMIGIEKPRVGLVNIGAEETKGNELTLESYQILSQCEDIFFVGNVEPTGITRGEADVLVCDGFTGNVIIKMYEGLGKLLLGTIKKALTKNPVTKLGALMVKDSLKKEMVRFDAHEYGGAPILGLKGLVLKTHGNAKEKEFANSILQCIAYDNYKGEN